tara:strand:- start:1062 stop:1619 length:558 start_codon:yes stop_codon:yes gene_type:complete
MEDTMLIPRQTAPALTVPTLDHGPFNLATATPQRGTVICFYRGLHCPICATYLTELDKQTPAFTERGIETIAISADGADRARAMADKIGATALRFGHDLPLPVARDWGLYISTSRGKTSIGIEEPALFSEPGLFIVNTDQSIYYLSVQSMPFVRPSFRELLGAVDFAIEKNYPARGEYTGSLGTA